MTGIIIKALSGFYYVESSDKIYECKARGSFRKSGISPLVGDRVEFDIIDDTHGVVNSIIDRKNLLARPNVANIDKLFIVSSFQTPSPNSFIIDKITAIAVYNNIEPIIVFNKCDMGNFDEWLKIYSNAGFKTYVVSAETGEGIDALKAELKGVTSAFTGNSGVGKSSILNRLFGECVIKTGEVSQTLGRGRHTTRHIEAYKLSFGGYVVDTPGFSSIENEEHDYDFKERLPELFLDFGDFIYNCRFTGCSHTKEKGCAVIEAVESGQIEKSRHQSYLQLNEELKDLKPWESTNYKKR
ncbi:MAG: ribosome small subunit-dependent GTPase A [Clostridia bacterium]|nr:ribosome small subunit-dependent GTPase A [Clostridia bacterium]